MNLLRASESGQGLGIFGAMRDDGTGGDAVAGDMVYTIRVSLTEPAGVVRLQARAAFRGVLARIKSPITNVRVGTASGIVLRPATEASSVEPGSANAMLLGPVQITRSPGSARTVRMDFAATGFEAPYVFFVRNGSALGTGPTDAGAVTLDGTVIVGASEFAQRNAGYTAVIPVRGRSALEVFLPPGAAAEVTVWVAAKPILQIQTAGAGTTATVGPAGGALHATGSDGTQYAFTVPAHALTEATDITMTPVSAIPNLPFTGGFRYGVRFAPEGLHLLTPAELQIQPSAPALSNDNVAFASDASGRGFRLELLRAGNTLGISVPHFSIIGVGTASRADVNQADVLRT